MSNEQPKRERKKEFLGLKKLRNKYATRPEGPELVAHSRAVQQAKDKEALDSYNAWRAAGCPVTYSVPVSIR